MPDGNIKIALTKTQIAKVLREAVVDPHGFSPLLAVLSASGVASPRVLGRSPEYSTSLARGFLVLASFPVDGSRQTIAETARTVGLSPSTVHRFVATWAAVGILDQDPQTRKYGLVTRGE